MSYTLISKPGGYYSAHGDLVYTVLDNVRPADTTHINNYKYVCDVFVNGNMVATLRAIPRPVDYIGVFNIGDVVRNYVKSVFNPVAPAGNILAYETGAGEFYATVQAKFYAEFFNDNVFTVDPDDGTYLVTDSCTVFNHYNGRLVGVNTALANFTNKVTSNRPVINYMNRGAAYCFLPYFPTATGDVDFIAVAKAGTTTQRSFLTHVTVTQAFAMQVLNVAPAALNAFYGSAFVDDSTTHVDIRINGGIIYTFKLTCEAVYTNYTLHFLNQYGGFESRDFSKVSRKTVAISKADFGKLPFTVDASGNVSYWNANNVYNETRSAYSSQYAEKLVLNTDLLNDQEYTWLGDLVISPLVFIEIGGYFLPCIISATNYEYRKVVNDKLTSLTINVEFGEQFNAQFR